LEFYTISKMFIVPIYVALTPINLDNF
jgi:hypothetical protein